MSILQYSSITVTWQGHPAHGNLGKPTRM